MPAHGCPHGLPAQRVTQARQLDNYVHQTFHCQRRGGESVVTVGRDTVQAAYDRASTRFGIAPPGQCGCPAHLGCAC